MKEPQWPLHQRHMRLPKWAQEEILELLCCRINTEMAPDVRAAAMRAFGGNCTFSDDDMSMLEHFAGWAVDQGYRADITDVGTLEDMALASRDRARDSGSDPKGENSRSEVECEASQSGGEAASPNPSLLSGHHTHDQ